MVEQMDMSYSYKPVLLKAVLTHADANGRVKISDIVDYFRSFYEARRKAGLIVEKTNSIYAKVFILTKMLSETFFQIHSSDLKT
ncbi:MAG: hypothetical protein PUD53_01385 [Oscillospiraceae bacterium]|nr:hypothetical protein [Oscillospiraceae bacterium]